jgi:hypothetical protein
MFGFKFLPFFKKTLARSIFVLAFLTFPLEFVTASAFVGYRFRYF